MIQVLPNYGAEGMRLGAGIQADLAKQSAQNRGYATTAMMGAMADLISKGKPQEAYQLQENFQEQLGVGKDPLNFMVGPSSPFGRAATSPMALTRDKLAFIQRQAQQTGDIHNQTPLMQALKAYSNPAGWSAMANVMSNVPGSPLRNTLPMLQQLPTMAIQNAMSGQNPALANEANKWFSTYTGGK